MAALVVRSSDAEKVLLAGLGHSHFQAAEKVSRIRDDAALQGGRSSGSGARSRKSKNGPKKQPQRGLGVAQLEKLRLQEQSKQDAACLASLGFVPLPPSYGFEGGAGSPAGLCLPHHLIPRGMKVAAALNASSLLPLAGRSHHNAGYDPMWVGAKDGDSPVHSDPGLSILLQQQQESTPFHGRPRGESKVACSSSEMMKNEEMKCAPHKMGDTGHRFGVNCVQQLFDASLPPGSLPIQARDCRELPMVGVPKELSSFQTKFPGNPVWPTLHTVSPQKRPCVVLQENPRVLISLEHGDIDSGSVQSETADNMLKGAHYTPRSISNALVKSSLPFLKGEGGKGSFENGTGKVIDPTDSMSSVSSIPFLQRGNKRVGPYVESPSPKKAAVGSDFLALSLSISHDHVKQQHLQLVSSDDSNNLQRSLSLQETVTDVEEGSQKSPSSCGNSGEVENMSKPAWQLRCFGTKCASSIRNEVDLSLKLAI